MDDMTRVRIRHLYFVERVSLASIAEALALSPHAVRGALILPGGRAGAHGPEPVGRALAPFDPTTPLPTATVRSPVVVRRRIAQRHR